MPKPETFHLNPNYFPESTRKLLPTSVILEYGALALGFKTGFKLFSRTRTLNLGFLNPHDSKKLAQIEAKCREILGQDGFTDTRVFKIKPEEFLKTLETVYHVDRTAIEKCNREALDPTLVQYLAT